MAQSVTRCNRAIILVSILLLASGNALAQTDDEHLGLTEYELACMPCHGMDGQGNGPMANQLKIRPSDLTQIAKSNGGIFPTARVFEIIDGRAAVAAHGIRDMPVWGDRYRVQGAPDDTQRDVDRRARAQIQALVRYLKTIQKN
ncbi:MAG: hypothetical protein ACI89J_001292 [Hyphomicrobiaceae bacterium]|jgi:hypothetical protein